MVLPRLHTDGMLVKDELGRTVDLTGVHWADLVDKGFFYCGPGVVNWRSDMHIRTGVAKEMGANHIRYSIALERYANAFTYTGDHVFDEYVSWMDKAVNELVNYGMYGYFVLHYGSSGHDDFMRALLDNTEWTFRALRYDGTVQGTYYTPHVRDTWMLWCEQLAAHYAVIPNVFGFQIWAEPAWAGYERTQANYEILFKKWRQFNLETVWAMRRGNPSAIVIVMSPGYYWVTYMSPNQWDGRNGIGILPEPNIMYGVQKYESEDHRGGAMQKAYSEAYENWYNGVEGTTLEKARELQEAWYKAYCFNFAESFQVPLINTEMAYCDDLKYNYKDGIPWPWQPEQAQGFYDIWKKYSQNWTQHRWQIGSEYGGGSAWGFFASVDTPNVGDYTLAPSGELMRQNFSLLPPPPGSHNLKIIASQPGIPVWVDGIKVGKTPVGLALIEGQHEVTVPEEIEI
jgi:hypothetical protein